MENRQVQAAVLVMALAATSGPAVAAGSGFYFGVNAGRSDFDASAADVVGPPVLVANLFVSRTETPTLFFVPGALVPAAFIAPSMVSTTFDERDTSWSATVGYTLNRYLSFELSYADLGELRASQTSTFPIPGAPQFRMSQELSVETVAVSALATLPLSERWSLFARGGYALSESEVTVGSSFANATMSPSISRASMDFDSDDFTVGAGVGFDLSSHWQLRADYERILDAGSSAAGSDVDVDTIGLTAIYRL